MRDLQRLPEGRSLRKRGQRRFRIVKLCPRLHLPAVEAINEPSEEFLLEWRAKPGRDHPSARLVLGAACAIAFIAGVWIFRSPILGIAGVTAILLSTAEAWLGAKLRLDAKGARSQVGASVSAIEWAEVRRVVRLNGGVLLTPLEKSGRMDAFRGVFVRYGAENRLEVEEAIRRFLPGELRFDVRGADPE